MMVACLIWGFESKARKIPKSVIGETKRVTAGQILVSQDHSPRDKVKKAQVARMTWLRTRRAWRMR